jgi:hypothetical protein
MALNFCTLFDRNYLFKGLTLYHSLVAHASDFHLWILCMDEVTFRILNELALDRISLIRLSEFEDEALRKVKSTRTVAEYCWTCTPCLAFYVLAQNPALTTIAYLDADLFFYGNPAPIYEEFGDRSVMIIEHRFPDDLKHLEVNGIYNVGMVIFRNDRSGNECLRWWRDRCLEWCFYRLEDGKMGDQKYLDDWPTRFRGVHVLQHKGAGLALWNLTRYKISRSNGVTHIDDDPLIFYHFHQFALLKFGSYDFGDRGHYSPLSHEIRELIYNPYIVAVERAIRQVRAKNRSFDHGLKYPEKEGLGARLKKFLCR